MSSTTIDRINGINSGVAIKAPCRLATTANITLSGEQTIDGVAAVAGDRVLVKSQTSGVNNGIYVVSTSAWQRDSDFDGINDVVTGTLVAVIAGTLYTGTLWQLTTTGEIIPGTTSLAFSQSSIVSSGTSLWKYSTDVNMADPATGFLRFNNSTASIATAMAISALSNDSGNPNFRSDIITWDDSTSTIKGTLTFKKYSDPSVFLTFSVTGTITDNTTWQQVTVSNVSSGGTLANNDVVIVSFARAGNAGASFASTDITGQSAAQSDVADYIVFSDTSASGALKKDTIQGLYTAANGLTEDTAPAGATDFVVSYDTSAGAAKKVKPTNLLKAINDLGTVTIDTAADYIPVYDTSGAVAGKVLASALSGGSGAMILLNTQTVSAVASVNFTALLNSTYTTYILECIDVVMSTAGQVWMRFNTGGGYISTATYTTYGIGRDSAGNPVTLESVGNNYISLTGTISNTTTSTDGAFFTVRINNPSHSKQTRAIFSGVWKTDGLARENHAAGGGHNTTTSAVTGVQFLSSSANISGTFKLYGIL